MNYIESKQALNEIRAKENEARSELQALSNRRSAIGDEISQAHENLIQIKAEHKAGERTEKEVSEAEKKYLSLKDEKASLDEEEAVAERVHDTFKEKVNKAEQELNRYKVPYYQEMVNPHFVKIQTYLDKIQDEIDQLNGYRKMMQLDQVPSSVLRGIKWKSKPVIRIDDRGSIEMRNYITKFEL